MVSNLGKFKKIKYFSMFSGVGGFELGIGDYGECVGFSEIDKFCSKLLAQKFPNIKNYGDATKINTKELPEFDLLVAGFPCQSFSIAGKRKGFDDTRGTLFFEIARVLRDKRPRYFLLENVKGLLFNKQGKTFQTILEVFANLGYFVEWQILNSKNFGVPQNRERVFIVGHFGGKPRRTIFPIGESSEKVIKEGKNKICGTITSRYWKQGNSDTYIKVINKTKYLNDRVYDVSGLSPTLNTMQGDGQPKILINGTKIRRLTPLECERLQGFPDNWTSGFSDTQRYKMMGNAVTVNVIRFLISQIIENYELT